MENGYEDARMTAARPTPAHTWLQLLRAPNLFTVPGDPLAGWLLASHGTLGPGVVLAVLASLALYGAGLLFNDLFDLDEDRAERPHRPLPSGAADPRQVRGVAILLMFLGNAMALAAGVGALCIAATLSLAILTYNRWAKGLPFVGAIVMGFCRGLSLLLGAAMFTTTPDAGVLVAVGALTLYIAAVTNLARHETDASAPTLAKILPPLPVAGALIYFTALGGKGWTYPGPATFAIALALVLAETARLFRKPPPPLPPTIGSLIRALLILQAAFCLTYAPGPVAFLCALALIAMWPVSHAVSRRFYAS
jgi:4-hydroxybenzoate polyprenyltransferase